MRGNIILSAIFIKQTLVSRHTKTKMAFMGCKNMSVSFPERHSGIMNRYIV